MSAPVDKRVDGLEGQCKTFEKSISGLEKSLGTLTKATDTIRSETDQHFNAVDAQFTTITNAHNKLADRVIALEGQRVSETELATFKKAFNTFTKGIQDAEARYAEEWKTMASSIAALEKRLQEAEKKVSKVIETHGGGV